MLVHSASEYGRTSVNAKLCSRPESAEVDLLRSTSTAVLVLVVRVLRLYLAISQIPGPKGAVPGSKVRIYWVV